MANTYNTLSGLFTATADAIRAKTGGTSPIKADDFPIEIANIPTGGGSVIPSDLPQDGKTRVGYKIPEDADTHGMTIVLYLVRGSSGVTLEVDWGDGTTETIPANRTMPLSHTYATKGEIIAAISATGGSYWFGNGNNATIYGAYTGADTGFLRSYVQWVVIGENVPKVGEYAFYYCTELKEVRFPASGVTEIGQYAFEYCAALEKMEIPLTVTTIGTYAFAYCYTMEAFIVNGNITTLANNLLQSSMSLHTLNVPATVETLGTSCFSNGYSLQKIRFNATVPPTATNSNSFNNVPASCVISVPTGYLSAYTSASNYPSSSTYTYIEED